MCNCALYNNVDKDDEYCNVLYSSTIVKLQNKLGTSRPVHLTIHTLVNNVMMLPGFSNCHCAILSDNIDY